MKILYITKGDSPDYLNDCILHGLYNLLGEDLTHTGPCSYMYKHYDNLKSLYGKGFTIFGTLPEYLNDNSDIIQKINTKYFDYIIYGSIHRDQSYLNLVLKTYKKNKIVFIDGEDVWNILDIDSNVLYFKRELYYNQRNLLPISFSIPEEKIVKNPKEIVKIRKESLVKPAMKGQYLYDNENDYYKDYQESFFGLTTKRGGWDCLRHYEILANYCIPYFPEIDLCPIRTMVNFPKNMIKRTNEIFNKEIGEEYYYFLNALYGYTKENLTTVQSVKNILDILKK